MSSPLGQMEPSSFIKWPLLSRRNKSFPSINLAAKRPAHLQLRQPRRPKLRLREALGNLAKRAKTHQERRLRTVRSNLSWLTSLLIKRTRPTLLSRNRFCPRTSLVASFLLPRNRCKNGKSSNALCRWRCKLRRRKSMSQSGVSRLHLMTRWSIWRENSRICWISWPSSTRNSKPKKASKKKYRNRICRRWIKTMKCSEKN